MVWIDTHIAKVVLEAPPGPTKQQKQAFDNHPGVGDACMFERAGRFHCAIKNVSQFGTTLLRNRRLPFGLTIGLGYPVTAIITTAVFLTLILTIGWAERRFTWLRPEAGHDGEE